MVSGIAELGSVTGGTIGGERDSPDGEGANLKQQDLSNAFLYLMLVQGLFTGLTIGKLAEGGIKAGIKHSFALMLISFVVSAAANIILGGVKAAAG